MAGSAIETARPHPGFFPLNIMGLSYRPYVFTADYFFAKSTVFSKTPTTDAIELSNEAIYGLHRPISVVRDTYHCTTRFDRLEFKYCENVARKICDRLIAAPNRVEHLSLIFRIDYPAGPALRRYDCDAI